MKGGDGTGGPSYELAEPGIVGGEEKRTGRARTGLEKGRWSDLWMERIQSSNSSRVPSM